MHRFKSILCVMEHGDASKQALERAVTLAEANQASLTVVDVVPRIPSGLGMPQGGPKHEEMQAELVRNRKARLEKRIKRLPQRHNVNHDVLIGIPFMEVIRQVIRADHDLVIKCAESPDWMDRLFTGDDMHLLRKCPCPVWMIKPQEAPRYKRILATVDVNAFYPPLEVSSQYQLNLRILDVAASLALAESAGLHIAYCWSSMSELVDSFVLSSDAPGELLSMQVDEEQNEHRQLLDALLQNFRKQNKDIDDAFDYLKPTTHLLQGAARREIPKLARQLDVDCVVMGTVGRTGISGLLMGNTSETILSQIDSSVLTIKPAGFTSPVTLQQ